MNIDKYFLLLSPTGSTIEYARMTVYTSDYINKIPPVAVQKWYQDIFDINENYGNIIRYTVYKPGYEDGVVICPIGAFGYIIYEKNINWTDFGILYLTLIQQQNLSYEFTT